MTDIARDPAILRRKRFRQAALAAVVLVIVVAVMSVTMKPKLALPPATAISAEDQRAPTSLFLAARDVGFFPKTLPGLGKLVLVNRKARMGRNPATGEAIQIKAKRVVKFRVAKAAKDAILGGK